MRKHTNQLGQAIGFPIDDWNKSKRPPSTSMIGRYCRVEKLDVEKHAEELYEAYKITDDESNWTYLLKGPFDSFEEFTLWLEEICLSSDPFFHTIIDLKTGKAVGIASYLRIKVDVGVIEIGHIHFSPLMQGTVVSTESQYLLMKRAFDELGYRRYEWKCDSLNTPSCNAAKRLGFTFEGVFRQLTMYKNRNRDTAWFSIIDSEWPALKTMFESWLAVDNFDANGKQKRTLQSYKNNNK